MRINALLYLIFFIQLNGIAQEITNKEYGVGFPVSSEEQIFNTSQTEVLPEFDGGIQAFFKYVSKNYRYPNVEKLNGMVFVDFVIEKDGSIVDIRVLKDIGFGTGEEAIRLLQNCPKWKPGFRKGVPVRVRYSLPIHISTY